MCNCCKTTGPLFTDADIDVFQNILDKTTTVTLLSNIFKSMKTEIMCCKASRVLDNENACMIYDVRPKACRNLHTDRKKFQQITDLTLKNVAICPAAFNIVEEMKKKLPL
jgi:Fe-S-cluster containining protein